MIDEPLRGAIAAELGHEVVSAVRVRGGDVASSWRVDLDDGRRVFAKTHPTAPPLFFSTEAAGLRWLAAAQAVAVPAVLAVRDEPSNLLVLEWIDEGRRSPSDESQFGRQLAELHRAGSPVFGRQDRRTTGSRGLPNEPCDAWAEFYGTQRLLPLARLAHGVLPPAAIAGLESLAGKLDEFAAADEPPARLHGDLWAGNRVVDAQGASWLIDPAAHGGHREFDLAMMRLFGGFGDAAFAAYDDVHPLAAGWPERIALHQIAPLVVHAVKFGGGYVGAAAAAIMNYV
ncbi:MAG: fructosamine kinase family protein [Ilumatobacteraceae bacterium]